MEKQTTQKVSAGHRYGHWLITGAPQRIGGDTRYPCQCVCGKEKLVSAITLRNGSSTSCGCQRKDRIPKMTDFELRPTPPDIQEIFQLISEGCLPPADQFSMSDGAPAWTLPGIAKILGVAKPELLALLREGGPRFSAVPNTHLPEPFRVVA